VEDGILPSGLAPNAREGLADFSGLFTEGGSFRRAEMPGFTAGKMPATTSLHFVHHIGQYNAI
jgi:hypothetical protein